MSLLSGGEAFSDWSYSYLSRGAIQSRRSLEGIAALTSYAAGLYSELSLAFYPVSCLVEDESSAGAVP
jgi:hypothetical protein